MDDHLNNAKADDIILLMPYLIKLGEAFYK